MIPESAQRSVHVLIALLVTGIAAPTATMVDSFETNPFQGSWRISGDSSLFQWNELARVVAVKWDSSRSNSFFWRALGSILTKADDFSVSFDLRIHEIRIGTTPGKPAEFPIAIGLLHRNLLTNASAFRGAGVSSTHGVRNIVEWNFFPDGGFGDTWATTVISSNNVFAYGHTFPLELVPESLYRITLRYTASDQLLRTTATRNGQVLGAFEDVSLANMPDFRLEAFSITSYSDLMQAGAPAFHGSVFARGSIGDVVLVAPPPPVSNLHFWLNEGGAHASFATRSDWVYTLERSVDLGEWIPATPAVLGLGIPIVLRDANATNRTAFYRVRAERP